MIEAEGIFENVGSGTERYDFVDDFASDIPVAKIAFEDDDQGALSCYIDSYGPKANILFDYQCIMQLEATRRGYGPNTSSWFKSAGFHK